MKDIVYIATDRTSAQKLQVYGGYNILPSLDLMVKNGTIYKNAIATGASTIMCHASEWLGLYTWEHKNHLDLKNQIYESDYGNDTSIFTDFQKLGYDIHIIFVNRKNKYYETYKQVIPLWPKETKIHLIEDWDQRTDGKKFRRVDHMLTILDCINESRARNKPVFVWIKLHGMYYNERVADWLYYANQHRPTGNDEFIAENDYALGVLLKELNYPINQDVEIWFGSDHGQLQGEGLKCFYGFHLTEEILHVPLICSTGGGKIVNNIFSMKEVRRLLTNNNPNLNEKYIYSETLYPGQLPTSPNNGKTSLAKISVRDNRYKYVYNPFGILGSSQVPYEELYDLQYDPYEKINYAEGLISNYHDLARPTRHNKSCKLIIERTPEILQNVNDGRLHLFPGEFQDGAYGGWYELSLKLAELREEARKVWEATGRGKYFKV